MCGEQVAYVAALGRFTGSPPRVRGTDNHDEFAPTVLRITPACAGNSTMLSQQLEGDGDHPRVCGEQLFALPPLEPQRRITPACAGNRNRSACSTQNRRDHPRVCGEQSKRFENSSTQEGSPPRVRGTGRFW